MKMKRQFAAGLAAVAAATLLLFTQSLMTAQVQDKAEASLKAAMDKETLEGDLKGAIEQYKKLAQDKNRSIAARALIRLAGCYEKLGQRDALAAYERVVREFADQAASAATASTRLAVLTRPGGGTTDMGARLVWEDAFPGPASISPDGRHLVYVGGLDGGRNQGIGALYVRDLLSGLNRRLTTDSTNNIPPVISPDGKLVAYGRTDGARRPADLRLITLDESVPPVFHQSDEWGRLSPRDWSADGKQILALGIRIPSDTQTHILLVSMADGSIRSLKTHYNPGSLISGLRLSRDGRYVVYDYPARGDSGERDIFILSAEGGQEARLVTRAADDRDPFFTPDGTGVLFLSRSAPGEPIGVWRQRVVDGRPQGLPELLRPDTGASRPIGFTSNGSFYYYKQESAKENLFTATLDMTNGTFAIQPAAVTQRLVTFGPSWSPDGQYIAFGSQRPSVQGQVGATVIVIRSAVTGEERELAPALSNLGQSGWSPDSRSLLVWGREKERPAGFYRLDVRTGDLTPIFYEKPGWNSTNEHWFPNEKSIVYIRQEGGSESIVLRDLETGRETELYRPPAPLSLGGVLDVSTGGQYMVFHLQNPEARTMSVMVMTLAGDKPRELGSPVKFPEIIGGVKATPDGRQVLYLSGNQESPAAAPKAWRIAVDGGAPQEMRLPMDKLGYPSFHPDGRQIAFSAAGPGKTSVWVLENFLPKTGAVR